MNIQGIPVRMIALQFSFSNPDVIPPSVKHIEQETQDELLDRKSVTTGSMIIAPVGKCSLVEFIRELNVSGYEMVDAFYKKRIDAKNANDKKKYHMVRFLFAYRDFVKLSDEFKEAQDTIGTELQRLCEDAIWRVRSFLNPFYKDGKMISGQCAVSINLEARQPLFYPDGQPVMLWQKDENGKRIGVAPLPLKADFRLCIQEAW